jgi:hypothetical protein
VGAQVHNNKQGGPVLLQEPGLDLLVFDKGEGREIRVDQVRHAQRVPDREDHARDRED